MSKRRKQYSSYRPDNTQDDFEPSITNEPDDDEDENVGGDATMSNQNEVPESEAADTNVTPTPPTSGRPVSSNKPQSPAVPKTPNQNIDRNTAVISPVAYCPVGWSPSSATYRLTKDMLKEKILALFRTYIDDLIGVDIIVDQAIAAEQDKYDSIDRAAQKKKANNVGEPIYGIAYIPSKSPNIIDQGAKNNPNTIIPIEITRFSRGVNDFLNLFCLQQHRRIYSGGKGYSAFRFSIPLVANKLFDRNGEIYRRDLEARGEKPVEDARCEIALRPTYRRGSTDRREREIETIEVFKTEYNGRITQADLNPKAIRMY